MKSLNSLCREYTLLSAMQVELLKRIDVCLPFIADMTHAHISLYLPSKADNKYFVLVHHKPHTFYSMVNLPDGGTLVSKIEEPLINYSFQTGKSIQGKREVDDGQTLDMYTRVIRDGNEIIAVMALETSHEYMGSSSYSQILNTTDLLLQYSRRQLDREMFSPINAGSGIVIADKNNRIVYRNNSAVRIYKSLGHTSIIGRNVYDRQRFSQVRKETIISSRPYERELEIGDMTLLMRDIKIEEAGNQQCRIVILTDVTEMRKKDREIKIKSAVIQEIHHRVKNNLQTIASLLRMQARRSKSAEVKEALKESVNRILSISVVHEFLSQQDDESIDVNKIARNIMDIVCRSMLAKDFRLSTEFIGPDIVLSSKNASKLSLVINELILNAIEHGFENRSSGKITVKTGEDEDSYKISVIDDGNGLSNDFDMEKTRSSLGLDIVNTIVTEEMGGVFQLKNKEENGAEAIIIIQK